MTDQKDLIARTFPMSRPTILVKTARFATRMYQRQRDLPGAVPGLLAQPQSRIVPKLIEVEARCEEDRVTGSAAYRPARHLQVLSALLAEAGKALRGDAAPPAG